MNERTTEKNTELEIDLTRLLGALLRKAWLIVGVAVICAVLALIGTVLFVAPKYQSSVMFYVNNNSVSLGDVDFKITSSDISASKSLVNTYIVILNTRETLTDVIDYAEANVTYESLKGMIKAEAVDATEIFRVTVTSTDPVQAEALAGAIGYILPKRINSVIQGTCALVVDHAVLPASPCSPSYTKNAMLGFFLGLVAVICVLIVMETLDNTIRTEEDITQVCEHPILAPVPGMTDGTKSTAYGYTRTKNKEPENKSREAERKTTALFGADIPFSALESYKLLRTKLQFSFTGENGCRVIGITSALSGEGKSVTAINLAYSLSELGKRVILLDGDMRRPTLAEKLHIKKDPGLSSCLTGQRDLANLVQYCELPENEKAFHVITAGINPPNPVELLSSNRMDVVLDTLRKHYDYVIVDMPPVTEVSDVLAVAQKLDGILLVVRQNVCNRIALNATVRQLAFVDAKILGVVFNGITEQGGHYGKKYYNKYYQKRYGNYYRRETVKHEPISWEDKDTEK